MLCSSPTAAIAGLLIIGVPLRTIAAAVGLRRLAVWQRLLLAVWPMVLLAIRRALARLVPSGGVCGRLLLLLLLLLRVCVLWLVDLSLTACSCDCRSCHRLRFCIRLSR